MRTELTRTLTDLDIKTISKHISKTMCLPDDISEILHNNMNYAKPISFIDTLIDTVRENKECEGLFYLPQYLNEIISNNDNLKDKIHAQHAVFYDVTLHLLLTHKDKIVHNNLSYILELTYDTTLGSYMNEYAYEDSDFDVRRFVHSLILLFCGTALIEWDYIAYIKEEFFHHNPRYQHLK